MLPSLLLIIKIVIIEILIIKFTGILSPHLASDEGVGMLILSPHIMSPRILSKDFMLVEVCCFLSIQFWDTMHVISISQ